MAIQTPEFFQTKTYSAKKDRRVQEAEIMQEGIVDKGDYAVTQRGAGANMSVDVAAGEAWVDGDSTADQGFYHVVNDATVNVTIAAANASNPRIDAVVLAVNDSTEIGGSDEFKLEAISGTATAGASLSNLTGKPAIGATKLLLAYVLVPASATKIENAQIGGLKQPRAGQTGFPAEAEPKAVAGAPPQYAHGRPLAFIPTIHAKRTAGQAIANSTSTALELNLEEYDPDEMHSTSSETTKIFCKTPGVYTINARCLYGVTNTVYCSIGMNGAISLNSIRTSDNGTHASDQIRMGYGDYITVSGQQLSGGASTFTGDLKLTWVAP